MLIDRLTPNRVRRTGDDSPVPTVFHYAMRIGGRHQIFISLLALLVAGLTLLPLELQRRIVNNAIDSQDVDLLLWLGVIYLAVVLTQSACKFLLRMYQSWLSESATLYTRKHLAEIRAKSHSDEQGSEGRTVAVLGAEVDRLGGFVGEGISQPIADLAVLLSVITYMLIVEPLVALLALAFLVPQALLVPFLQRAINRLVEHRLSLLRSVSDVVAQQEERGWEPESQILTSRLTAIYKNRMKTFLVKFALKAANNILTALAPLGVLLVGGYFVILGETSLGVVVAFMSGFDRMASPLRELMAYYRMAAQANVQHAMIARWM
ncbi:MAG: ABC transporter ATP-binding protein [Kiloniellales bacterium]